MNRGDILAKLQSTASAAETRALSITDAAIQNKTDANALNAFDAQSVFKLISSASDLEQRFGSDKEFDSVKNEAAQLEQFDMQATTKNKRKNFKPRNATAVDVATAAAAEPSLTDQFILNLMMQNKMKQLQQELHQGQFKRWNDDGKVDQQMTGGDSDRSTTSNNNESCNSLKSPPSSPLGNGHGASGENAYNAVQDLLSVYGLTMSPNDVVDAFNRRNEAAAASIRDLANNSLLRKGSVQQSTQSTQKQQQNALVPPTPPRTPITPSAQHQQMTDGVSDDDDNSESKSVDSMANRKRKLNTILGSNKRMHVEQPIKTETDPDSDSNHDNNDRATSINDNDDGTSSRMSDFDDGNASLKNRAFTDTNDASFDSSYSAYLQETKQQLAKATQPPLNLSQSLSNIVDVSGLSLAKDKYFERPSMSFLSPAATALKMVTMNDESKLIDSGKYLSKYASFMECNHDQCAIDKLREHFHCLDILCMNVNKVLCKREEVLRHLKWHKKRNESLTHGFLRFSSTDDCSIQFGECQHNGKQTHYHCLQGNCDKVYISTSDVQMHSNYHRKDSAIMQEGFQRFRATEECAADFCSFAGQRTTHFHCIRDSCNYTFKNKAEMEKHKTYHIKDELLARDGFKKFMKNEPCSFDRCRFSLQCNHIHCVRDNCFYVLHSSGQLLSHKRKHERMDSEQAYQQFKMAQKSDGLLPHDNNDVETRGSEASGSKGLSHFPGALSSLLTKYAENENKMESLLNTESVEILQQLQFQKQALLQSQAKAVAASLIGKDDDINSDNNNYDPIDSPLPKSFVQNASASIGRNITSAELDQLKQIYSAAENAKQKQINALLFAQNNFNSADQSEPLNLNLKKDPKDVNASLLSAVVQKIQGQNMPANLQQITSIDGLFNRKRGRPPKNRVVEVYGNVQTQNRPQAIFTSFKLEKNGKASSPLPSESSFRAKTPLNRTPENHGDESSASKESPSNFSIHRLNDSGGSGSSDRKRRLSFSSSQSNDNEKVSIVRAAGTFFPQNCDNDSESSPPLSSRRKSKESVDYSKKCSISNCNQPNDSHVHCDDCSEVFDDETKLLVHSVKHKANETISAPESDPSQELMQNFAKQMAKQSETMFNMESFMNPAASVISNLASLNQNQMAMGGEGFSFNDQLSAQIQTLCLAQLAHLYQNNPMMSQHLYPLLGAVEQMKQQDAQRMFMPPVANPLQINNPFGAFDLSSIAAVNANKKPTTAAAALANSAKLQRQVPKLGGKVDTKANKGVSASDVVTNRNAGSFKIFKDEPIPKGYLKFKFNEDCRFAQCGYSNLQSHFHCCRTDCHYSFCDKTRFVQHTARHERLDKLMGDDFKQYRANMSCGHDDCVYKNNLGANNKSSHFHCLKCDFICSDTNKVVAHRRHHSKLEYIRTAGFRKVANNEPCTVHSKKPSSENGDENVNSDGEPGDESNATECIYSMKQTHYHCLVCDCSVLSRAQLSSHQHK
ncbi:uncharacterized protein LOC129576294 isoform X2 [Sitodiplosis mosellana]|uniref:uncharacterized protein LOC129576294 isoform X2 n=1 Tax=Sitodiplosis mosellana TaxID=263140 RepID=UPI002444443B|nr:uncharacterized protein LOC129576294 isoform X2 [Sitodiplosis mosellana]XP_055317114.1 uncharacterized protein LOC129576294 isoform X2 [Sitodiplosis mosellana]